MNTFSDFETSLLADQPPAGLSVQLKALWYDARGEWHSAHEQVDKMNDLQSAWVHAYLHRKEGDLWNADYWYNKAAQSRPTLALDEEWKQLVLHFLHG
jgi:hypothetical protein